MAAIGPDRSSRVALVEIAKDSLRDYLRLLVDHASAVPGAKATLLSFVPGVGDPEAFYRRLGFEPTGEVSEGEHVMRLAF